jgi:hypothetical protein
MPGNGRRTVLCAVLCCVVHHQCIVTQLQQMQTAECVGDSPSDGVGQSTEKLVGKTGINPLIAVWGFLPRVLSFFRSFSRTCAPTAVAKRAR